MKRFNYFALSLFASLITIFLAELYNFNEWTVLLISTVLLLLFGELIPKYIAREFADSLILVSAIPLKFISVILTPFVKFTDSVSLLLVQKNQLSKQLHHPAILHHPFL